MLAVNTAPLPHAEDVDRETLARSYSTSPMRMRVQLLFPKK